MFDRSKFLFALGCLATLFATPQVGNAVFIVNDSFEDDILVDGDLTVNTITDWSVDSAAGDAGVINPLSSAFGSIPDGENVAYTDGGEISQSTAALFDAAGTYTVSFEVGDDADVIGNFGGFRVELLAGSTVLFFQQDGSAIGEGAFLNRVFMFGPNPANAGFNGQPVSVRLQPFAPGRTYFDSVSLVPEPSSFVLVGALALVGGFTIRRRSLRS